MAVNQNDPDVWPIVHACLEYVRVARREGYTERLGCPDGVPTDIDAQHSALLPRLLSGKKPLPEPPPLRHSYPDYAAVEEARHDAGNHE